MPGKNQVILTFAGDADRLHRAVDGVDRKLGGFGGTVKKLAGAAAGLFVFDKVADVIGGFIGEAEEAAKVGRQTEAVLKSTGGVAKVTARDVDTLATSLSRKAGIDDDLIASGQNVLLTFTKVRNEVGAGNQIFDRATTAALDMSAALGTDMQGAVTQVGKALNDPIAGLTSLTRAGVQFTDQQKQQIRTMVETGDILGAQKIILSELETQFGGSAEANATATGRMKVAWGEVGETIGGLIIGPLEDFAVWFAEVGAPAVQRFAEDAATAISEFTSGFSGEAQARADAWVASETQMREQSEENRGDQLRGWEAFGAAVGGFWQDLQVAWDDLLGFMEDRVIPGVQFVLRWLDKIGTTVMGILDWVRRNFSWEGLKNGLVGAINWIVGKFNGLIDDFNRTVGRIPGVPDIGHVGTVGGGGGERGRGGRRLAHGGVVAGAFSQVVPITAHGGEMVLNPRQQQELFRLIDSGARPRGGGPTIVVHVHGSVLSAKRDVAEVVADTLRNGGYRGLF